MDSPLYGTLEAPMYWHNTYVNWVTSVGYTVCKNDRSVFVHPDTKHRVAKHVDDLFARGQKKHNDWFMDECSKRFPVKGWHRLTTENSVVWCGVT